jgi:phage-related minor tail protein
MAGLQTGLDDTVVSTDKVVIATAKQINAIQSAADAYHEETKAIIENLKMQNALIGKSDEQKRVMEALHEEGQRFRAEELRLTNAVADAKAQGTDEELAKIPLLQAQLEKLRNTHQGTLDVIEQLVVANTGLTDQYQLQQFAIKTNIDLQNQLTKLQLDTANIGLTTLEKKYADVDAAATASAKAAIEAEEARRGAPLNNAEVESYYAKAREGSVLLKEGIKEAYDESRTFDAGWKESMNSYVETITSSANLAKGAFESMTSNMESSIDDFVESGKFSFGDLAKSIIKDIQKMILKMVIFNALKAAGTAFGIPGFAEGGNVKAGGPIMVGEKGPELFVPPSSGKIIPNNQLGKGGSGATVQSAPVTNNYITNNIQAMDSRSVAQVFSENRKTLLGTVRMAENEMPY